MASPLVGIECFVWRGTRHTKQFPQKQSLPDNYRAGPTATSEIVVGSGEKGRFRLLRAPSLRLSLNAFV
jgi:hypothetical protein